MFRKQLSEQKPGFANKKPNGEAVRKEREKTEEFDLLSKNIQDEEVKYV